MRVGFLTLWFERGQAHVTRTLAAAMQPWADVFIFARTATVLGERRLETAGVWAHAHLTTWPDYEVPREALAEWVVDNRRDIVVFNEEHEWSLVRSAAAAGARVVTYLDWFGESWRDRLGLFDAVLCSTRRTYDLVRDCCAAEYIGFAVDVDSFDPQPSDARPFTFFHNAGWLGLGFRKMTPAVVLAFHAISVCVRHATLLIHAQVGTEHLPPLVRDLLEQNDRIEWRVASVGPPGLYGAGRVLLFPSKLEGLGLPMLEGLAAGLPVVSVDHAPMDEFVLPGITGVRVPVALHLARSDGVAFPEAIVDVNAFALAMAELAEDADRVLALSAGARDFAQRHLRIEALGARLRSVLEAIS